MLPPRLGRVTLAGGADTVLDPIAEMVIEDGGRPVSSLLGRGGRVPAQAAALFNGTAAHLHDYDDTHFEMYGHPSAATIAAAMAVAERQRSSGRDLLEAVIAGVEVTCRLGVIQGYPVYKRGFSPSSQTGIFGATAAVCKLLKLDQHGTAVAFGFAAAQACGLHGLSLSTAATFQIGWAAVSAVSAGDLALRGVTATLGAIECHKGYVLSRNDEPQWQAGLS